MPAYFGIPIFLSFFGEFLHFITDPSFLLFTSIGYSLTYVVSMHHEDISHVFSSSCNFIVFGSVLSFVSVAFWIL